MLYSIQKEMEGFSTDLSASAASERHVKLARLNLGAKEVARPHLDGAEREIDCTHMVIGTS
jgi:hypothetical protein